MENSIQYESNKFWFKLKLAFYIIAVWWFVSFFNLYSDYSLTLFSLKPKTLNFIGIFTYPFVHGDIEHLINNSLSGFLVFSTLFLIYEKISIRVLLLVYLLSGILLWIIGVKGSMHIGASSVIYGIAFFLFFSGIIIRESSKLATSLFIVAWYGSMIWGITPFTVENGISWEGHLSGAIIGSILAFWFHREDLVWNKNKYSHEIEEEDFHFFEKYPLDKS